MKKSHAITLAIALFVLLSGKSIAQWTSVYSDINATFRDAAFPTDNTGYIAASDSSGTVVLRTANGGVTWNKKYIPEWRFIDKITMSDSIHGYMIKGGVPAQILKTNDGFNTYTIRSLDDCFVVQALQLINDSTGFYLNNGAKLRKFTNNGASFSVVFDTLFDGQNLQFTNPRIGYFDNGSRLFKTNDAGTNWRYTSADLGFYTIAFNFADSQNGYFSDTGKIFKTTDGGVTFSPQYNFRNVYNLAARGNFCIAANDTGNVAFTTNAGATWVRETTGINLIAPEPFKVVVTPGGFCYLFGEFSGEVLKRNSVPAAVTEISKPMGMAVYPNPFTSQTTISFREPQHDAEIRLTDVAGKEVKKMHCSGTQVTLERGALQAGIYLLTVTDNNHNRVTTKITIQ